jgi:AcrR family transcriptional regulator
MYTLVYHEPRWCTPHVRGTAKQALLEGAQACLARDGFSGTTARTVAAASGANLRSIAYHYGSLDELLLAAMSANFRTWMSPLIAEVTGEGDDAAARVRRGLSRFVAELPRRAGLVAAWLEAVGRAERDPDLRERLAANQARFRDMLAGTLAEADAARPEALATALISACDGLMIRFVLHGQLTSVEDLARELADYGRLAAQ